MELQLEVLAQIREQIRSVFGKDSAIDKALKVELDPNNSERIIIRSGDFFLDGNMLTVQAGTDHRVGLGAVDGDSNIDSSDFIRVEKDGLDDGGIAINFGGATPADAKEYSIVVSVEEQLITAAQDPFLRSANLNEDTAEKHRIIVNINIIESNKLDESPIPYVGTNDQNLVNEIKIERSGGQYALISSSPLTGSEAIDGRNLEVVFNNGNGGSTAAFPISNVDLQEFVHGKLVDSNGMEFHITNMFVTPANPSTITMQLDLEKTRPVQPLTYQPEPQIVDGVEYKVVKRDLYVTTPANLPVGKRFWEIAKVQWDGSSFTSIEDLRQQVLAFDGVLSRIRESGLTLHSEANLTWDKTIDDGKLTWDQPLIVASVFDMFQWQIAANDTSNLFGSLEANEVLYFRLADAPMGGSVNLRKGIRGQGDLTLEGIQAHKIEWIAKRGSDDRIYFSNGTILNNQQTKTFFDPLPEELLTQDIISLGFSSMYEDRFFDASAASSSTTGLYFAESFLLEYDNQTITVSGNEIEVPSPVNFTLQEGDVVVQGTTLAVITQVNSQTSFEVDDSSGFSTGVAATISQVLQTENIRDIGDDPKERISSYFTDLITEALVTYDDSVLPNSSNAVMIGYQITGDGSDYTIVQQRQQTYETLEQKVNIPTSGLDVRLRFFAVNTSGSGVATLESFRTYIHKREFVGSLIAAVAQQSTQAVGAGNFLQTPELDNVSGDVLLQDRVVGISGGGIVYASAASEAQAKVTIGVLLEDVAAGGTTNNIVGSGLAPGALSSLGFISGDSVYLGLNGELVSETEVDTNPSIIVQKQIGVAVNSNDLWVSIQELEIL